MQKSIAPYIKQFSRNNNSQLGTEISGAFFVLELISRTKRDEGGGYKWMKGRLVRDPPLIYLHCPNLKIKIGFRKQELLEKLSNYDYMTPFRRASMKRHGQTAGWLTESVEFANWMAEPKSSVFILSGKRKSLSEIDAHLLLNTCLVGSGKTVTTFGPR